MSTLALSASFLAPIGPQHRAAFNAARYGNHVTKAVYWTDGGSEFVFMDGTVLSFMDDMNTFVAVNPSASPTQRDLMLTSLCLSTYEDKVKAALAVYNRFAVHPRLVHGLCSTQEFIWQKASPIEALVLGNDPSLFSREYLPGAGVQENGAPPLAHSTLWCAMRKVRLTIHASGQGFQVAWPAKVSETDGSTTVFVPPINEHGEYIHALASQRACRYVLLEQWFWMERCPKEWSEMVQLCLEMDRTVPHAVRSETTPDVCGATTSISLSTPAPLAAPRLPPGLSAYLADRSSLASSRHHQHQQARFSELQVEDGHSFIASTQLQSCPAQQRLHPASRGDQVVWRWDCDPSGRSPSAFFHCWEAPTPLLAASSSTASSTTTTCAAFVMEDDAVIIGRGSHTSSTVRIQLQRAVLRVALAAGPVQTPAVELESREYMQDGALSLVLPKSINTGLVVPVLGFLGTSLMQSRTQEGAQVDAVRSTSMEYGRYLPNVTESIVALVGRAGQRPQDPPHRTDPAPLPEDLEAGSRAVKLTTRVDSVGTFTALTNGVCRAVFDDRVIVTLIPDAYDSDEGLVCEMRGRDGTVHAVRVAQCVNTHAVFDYLAYLLPFRNFARMSEVDQRHLALTMPPAHQYERTPIFSSDVPSHNGRPSQHESPPLSSYVTDNGTYLPSYDASSVDMVMLNTSGTLMRSEASRARARKLLNDLAY
jgi:hypothetical protein